MFAKLIDFIFEFASDVAPWFIVRQWQGSLVLRFGLYIRERGPGIHWKIPFVEQPLIQSVVITTKSLPAQSFPLADGTIITVQSNVKYKVKDLKTFVVDIYDSDDVMNDCVPGVIREVLSKLTKQAIFAGGWEAEVTKRARKTAFRWGVEIEDIVFAEIVPCKVYRFIHDQYYRTLSDD